MKKRLQSQPRVKNRVSTYAGLIPELRREVEREAGRYAVSKSWVVTVALAKHFDVYLPKEADYRMAPSATRRR